MLGKLKCLLRTNCRLGTQRNLYIKVNIKPLIWLPVGILMLIVGIPFLFLKHMGKEDNMLKIRLQGTRNDIRWFLKILEKDNRFDVFDTSDIMSIKTSNRYKRLYTNIFRKQISTVHKSK